jgi:hypothetical protein
VASGRPLVARAGLPAWLGLVFRVVIEDRCGVRHGCQVPDGGSGLALRTPTPTTRKARCGRTTRHC